MQAWSLNALVSTENRTRPDAEAGSHSATSSPGRDVRARGRIACAGAGRAEAVEAAQSELIAAQNDLKVAQKQFAILKASPTPEELAEENAKVAEAQKVLMAKEEAMKATIAQLTMAAAAVTANTTQMAALTQQIPALEAQQAPSASPPVQATPIARPPQLATH